MARPSVKIVLQEELPDLPPIEQAQDRRRWLIWAGLLAGLVFIAFVPSLTGQFISGDDTNVINYLPLRSWRGLWAIWRYPHQAPQFSPLGYTAYLLEFRLFGASGNRAAAGYHLVSVLLHLCNVLLLWTFLSKLELKGAWLGAAGFAVHPLQVQSVAWITRQPMLLGACLLLMSLIVYARYCGLSPEPFEVTSRLRLPQNRLALYLISMALLVLATLAYPPSAAFALIAIILIWWERGKLSRADVFALVGPVLLLLVAAGIATALYLRQTLPALGPAARVIIAARAIGWYMASIIVPVKLAFAYPAWVVADGSRWQWVFPLAVVVAVGVAWQMRREWGRSPIATLALFLVVLLPGLIYLNPGATWDGYVADSGAYLAVAIVVIPLVASLTDWFGDPTGRVSAYTAPPWLACACLLLMAVATSLHSTVYKTALQVWGDTLAKYPDSAVALNTLGEMDLLTNHPLSAEEKFRMVLQRNDRDLRAMINLARVYEARGDYEREAAQYLRALQAAPYDPELHALLGNAFLEQGNTAKAVEELNYALSLDPRNLTAHLALAATYIARQQFDKAMEQYDEAYAIDPRCFLAYLNCAKLLISTDTQQGISKALSLLQRANEIDPRSDEVFVSVGVAHVKMGKPQEAMKYFRQAISINPNCHEGCDRLGVLLAQESQHTGNLAKLQEALYYFTRAAELKPDNREYQLHLAIARQQLGPTAPK